MAEGVEDYYLGGEAPGEWIASSDTLVRLAGPVRGSDLVAVLEGRDPSNGTRLGRAHKVPGFDLTFSAPKSVSVLFGLADHELSLEVRDAHDGAVAAAVEFIERHAAWTRKGTGGIEQVRTDGLIAAAFRHRTSRAGDPHLHTHVLVANTVRSVDGVWRTLDARHLYPIAKTAGYLYEAELRDRLTRRIGVVFGPVANGIADIDNIPPTILEQFSKRSQEKEAAMAQRGQYSARAAQIAVLDTRRAKSRDIDPTNLVARWRAEARDHGFPTFLIPGVINRTTAIPMTAQQRWAEIEAELVSAVGLTEHASAFTRRTVLRAWCDRLPAGASITELEARTDALLSHVEIVGLGAAGHGDVIRDPSGRILSALPAEQLYTTRELLDLEHDALMRASRMLGDRTPAVSETVLAQTMAHTRVLSREQSRAVSLLTMSTNSLDILTAPAGAGKTTALAAARTAWETTGHHVVAAAHTGVAADAITTAAGIPASTLARFLIDVEHGSVRLDERTVVVIDEAGTAGTRTLTTVLRHVEAAGARLVLVGDPKQIPEIEAGGLFAGLIARQPTIELSDNHRQRHEWEQDALRQLRNGDVGVALDAYQRHERIITAPTAADARSALVAAWWIAQQAGEDAVMLATRRREVAELNVHGRTRAIATGQLHGPALVVGEREFQVGDRVIALRNNTRLAVRNGNRGTITRIDHKQRTIAIDVPDRGERHLPAEYLDAGHLDHAYAMTVHKAHGLTCDRVMLLATDDLYRELAYTALSRGRLSNHLYLATAPPEPVEEPHTVPAVDKPDEAEQTLQRAFQRRRAQQLATDQQAPEPLQDWPVARLVAERTRLITVFREAPPDRAGDILKCTKGIATERDVIASLTEDRARIAGRHRPLLQRRRPDPDLERCDWLLANRRARLHDHENALAGAELGQHERSSYLARNIAEDDTLESIKRAIKGHVNKAVARSATDVPDYVVRRLGPRPTHRGSREDQLWIHALVSIETYRTERGVTDSNDAIGPKPDGDLAGYWAAANNAVNDMTRLLHPVERGRVRPDVPLPDVPGL